MSVLELALADLKKNQVCAPTTLKILPPTLIDVVSEFMIFQIH